MEERKISELQKEYRAFFLEKMNLYSIKSPAELTKEKKSVFFLEIKHDWAKYKNSRKRNEKVCEINIKQLIKDPITNYEEEIDENLGVHTAAITYQPPKEFSKKIIYSNPNKEQTVDLRILYTPNTHFAQPMDYLYPVVKMPKPNSSLKLPRLGRTNQKGYKENDFFNEIKKQITDIDFTNNVHMVIPHYNKPYEPDIVLFDKRLNLYIDIEIDEPYDGYFRYPTHCLNSEVEKQDNIRDLFFTESGWIVIRFTERQVHCTTLECIDHIKNVLNSIYNRKFNNDAKCEKEEQWEYIKCVHWQKIFYREKYLGITHFIKHSNSNEIEIDIEENESIESVIQRTKKELNFEKTDKKIAFDKKLHKYYDSRDETGNAEYISVTTLIDRFFPFDLKKFIEKKAIEEEKTEEDVLIDYLMIRDEAADKGTELHKQIENYLNGKEYVHELEEFKLFTSFYKNEIMKRNLAFYEAEKIIYSDKYNVSGTIDCLFKKHGKDEYVMLDWKRSKKLIIDGHPKKYGYGFALAELNHLDNSSYYKYCLQQNIYKFIIESEYSLSISSMKLVVLHENYSKYYVVDVPEMKKEAKVILNSLKHKI